MQTPSQVFIRSWVKRKIFRVEVDGVPHSFYSRATCPPVSSYDSKLAARLWSRDIQLCLLIAGAQWLMRRGASSNFAPSGPMLTLSRTRRLLDISCNRQLKTEVHSFAAECRT